MPDLKKFAEQLVNLSIKDVTELSAILKEEYGIEPAAVAAPVTVAVGGVQAEAAAAEKTSFDVILKSAGASKLAVVKMVKDLLNVELRDAKALVDAAPKAVREGLPKEEAESLKSKLEEAGAEVELK
jgi:large subunit ribosomal protein L7/L12